MNDMRCTIPPRGCRSRIGGFRMMEKAKMTWYKVTWYLYQIEAVVVLRETEKQIVLEKQYLRFLGEGTYEQRVAKHSSYDSFYPTFKEAKAELLSYVKTKLTAVTESKLKLESLLTDIEKLEA